MTLIHDDCLNSLKNMSPNTIDMIYLDPPFYTQKTHRLKKRATGKEYEFDDSWDSLNEYLNFIRIRIIECHRVLKKTGSIFLHCDKNASHFLRMLLDEIFGSDNFRNEIIWSFKRWSSSKSGLQNSHQNIFFYSKTESLKFNTIYTDYSPTTNLDQILQNRCRDIDGKAVYQKDDNGNVIVCNEKKGVPLSDVWEIPFLNPKAAERTGYPTQKPILLLEQIIKISTEEGDTVLDPFCGSGTTLIAAKLLKRNFIGIDRSQDAISLCTERLKNPFKTTSKLLEEGHAKYNNKSEYELSILKCLDAFPVQRNSGIDGLLRDSYEGKPVAVKIQKPDEELCQAIKKLEKSMASKGCKIAILVKTQSDNIFDFSCNNCNVILISSLDLLLKESIKAIRD